MPKYLNNQEARHAKLKGGAKTYADGTPIARVTTAPPTADPQTTLSTALTALSARVGAGQEDIARALAELALHSELLARALLAQQAALAALALAPQTPAPARSFEFTHERDSQGKIKTTTVTTRT